MQKSIISSILTVSTLALLVACAPQVEPEESCNFIQNSQLQRVSWPHKSITVGLHKNVIHENPEYEAELEKALRRWVDASGTQLFGSIQIVDDVDQGVVDILVRMETDWDDERYSEQAKTVLRYKGSDIYEAEVHLNREHNQFYAGVVKQAGKVHMESLLIHELGHAIGLKHISGEYSVMNTHLSTGKSRIYLSETDIQSVQCEY